MIRRRIGNSDIYSSLIGYGCWEAGKAGWTGVNDKDSLYAIEYAIDHGINYFDTAAFYGQGHAEKILGQAVKGKRDKVYIATKCGLFYDENNKIVRSLKPDVVQKEIDDSLKRLGVDYIDIIQGHWDDYNTPIEDTMEAFVKARGQGKIRYVGGSNLNIKTADRARKVVDIISNQVLYNLIDRNSVRYITEELDYLTEKEIVPFCEKNNIGLIPYSPLGQGFLSERFRPETFTAEDDFRKINPMFEQNVQRRKDLLEIAHVNGLTLSELAILWLAKKEVIVSIIVSSINVKHIQSNIDTLEKLNDFNLEL